MEVIYETTILPVLQKIGQLWQVNSLHIIQEHYFSNIVREFFISKIEAIKPNSLSTQKALLFLHDNEEHEFALLIYSYLLKQKNYECFYLGPKTPINEISEIFDHIKPQLVITTFTSKISDLKLEKIEKKLIGFSSQSKVIISGAQLMNLNMDSPGKLIKINSIIEFKSFLQSQPT